MCLLAICISSHILWSNVWLGLWPVFWLGCLFFLHWAMWAACIFWTLAVWHAEPSPVLCENPERAAGWGGDGDGVPDRATYVPLCRFTWRSGRNQHSTVEQLSFNLKTVFLRHNKEKTIHHPSYLWFVLCSLNGQKFYFARGWKYEHGLTTKENTGQFWKLRE